MIRNIFSKPSQTITHAALFIGAASFISRLIGLLRDRILAHTFGAGPILDAYYSAFLIPDFIYTLLIVGALSASFIPSFISIYDRKEEDGWKFFNATIIICGITILVITSGLFCFAHLIIPTIVPGLSSEAQQLSINMTKVMLLSPILLGTSSIISGALQSQKLFLISSLSPIFYNVGIISGAIFLVPLFGPIALTYGVIMGAFFHLIIQIPSIIHLGYKPKLRGYNKKELYKMCKSSIPRIFSLGSNQIQTIIMAGFASTLTIGGVSMYTFANNIQSFPIGLIGVSFAIAAFPTLTQAAQQKREEQFISQLIQTMRIILIFIIPITIMFLLLRMQTVRILLGSGSFDWTDTVITGNTLGFFAISLFAQCLIPLLTRGFFAKKDTKTPSLISIGSVIITIVLAIFLKTHFGIPGLALAISSSSLIQLSLLFIILTHHTKTICVPTFLKFLTALSVGSVAMALVVQFLKYPISLFVDMDRFWGILTQGFITATIGLIVYLTTLYLFKIEEIDMIKRQIQRKFFSKKPTITELVDTDTSL